MGIILGNCSVNPGSFAVKLPEFRSTGKAMALVWSTIPWFASISALLRRMLAFPRSAISTASFKDRGLVSQDGGSVAGACSAEFPLRAVRNKTHPAVMAFHGRPATFLASMFLVQFGCFSLCSLNKHIHLLPHIKRDGRPVQLKNNLENAGIHPFHAVSG